ncbi:MAG: LOW QUALITY PROTEIN: hypothetical protein JOS17DRAFT_748206 [Linnemannia elongata]|nr:MAG: LOW QUALITY PROTEIN: hypothetical protein JOS17DRAFT_748206 [Linnemannia elongata]
MMLSRSSEQSQAHHYSQHSRHPYNPYPHQSTTTATLDHQPQCPQYTLQAQTPLPTVVTSASSSPSLSLLSESSSTQSSIQSSSPPPPDMLFALERLLMGISPFPPTIPTLAKPTCPSLDDLNPSRPADSTTALSTEPNFGYLDRCYRSTANSNNTTSPITAAAALSQDQQYLTSTTNNNNHPHHRSTSHGSISSVSPTPTPLTFSPSNMSASSPMYGMDSDHDMPYWGPSSPPSILSTDHRSHNHNHQSSHHRHNQHHRHYQQQHLRTPPQQQQLQHWSAGSSPLSPPEPHQQDSFASPSASAATWGYSLFEPTTQEASRTGYTSSSNSNHHHRSSSNNHVSFHHRSPTHNKSASYLNSRSTPAGSSASYRSSSAARHTSSSLSDVRAYESGIRHSYYSPRHYRTSTTSSSTSSSSSSSSSSPTSNNNSGSSNHGQGSSSSGNNTNSQSNTGNNTRSDSSNSGGNGNNDNTRPPPPAGQQTGTTRGEPKSFPCQICTKPFPTRTQLKSHMAIHVDNFPFPCPYTGCDLHFKRKHDLRRHVDAKHALYLCSGGCGEGFGRRDQMLRHLKRGHCQIKPEGDPARGNAVGSSSTTGGERDATGTSTTACGGPPTRVSYPYQTHSSPSSPSQQQQQKHSHSHSLSHHHHHHHPSQHQQQQQQQLRGMNLPPMSLPLS